MTAEEFAATYLDVPGYELVRGEVVELMPGGLGHSRVTGHAYSLVENWAQRSGLGRTFTGETGLIVDRGPDTVRGADVAYFSYARLPAEQPLGGFSEVPADLVIEVVGKGQGWDAMAEKAGEYLRMGVLRVWILDPESRTLHVFRKERGPVELAGDQIVRDEALLPGFECRVSDFFRP